TSAWHLYSLVGRINRDHDCCYGLRLSMPSAPLALRPALLRNISRNAEVGDSKDRGIAAPYHRVALIPAAVSSEMTAVSALRRKADIGAGCGGLAIGAMALKEPNASGSVRHLPHLPGAGSWRAGQMRMGVATNNRATPKCLSTVLPRYPRLDLWRRKYGAETWPKGSTMKGPSVALLASMIGLVGCAGPAELLFKNA